MKKVILTTIILGLVGMISACGKQGYTPLNPVNPSPQPAGPTDPITKFNTIWTSENDMVGNEFDATQKRTLSNFFGYNSIYKAWKNCTTGFKGNTAQINCMASNDPERVYFISSDYSYKPYPAPKVFGDVQYYKIRFAANVSEATGKIIEGEAYIDIELHTDTDTFVTKFSVVKTGLVINESTGDLSVTLQDGCGDIRFAARLQNDGRLTNSRLTFSNNPDSYKTGACYHDGILPQGMQGYTNSMQYPSSSPVGIYTYGGRGYLFYSTDTGLHINTFYEE